VGAFEVVQEVPSQNQIERTTTRLGQVVVENFLEPGSIGDASRLQTLQRAIKICNMNLGSKPPQVLYVTPDRGTEI
jgi:hypothetical protein